MTLMIHRLKQTTYMYMTVLSSQNCLKCDIGIFTLWNWEKNGCYFTTQTIATH